MTESCNDNALSQRVASSSTTTNADYLLARGQLLASQQSSQHERRQLLVAVIENVLEMLDLEGFGDAVLPTATSQPTETGTSFLK